jgi:hypothetical protein
LPLYADIVFSIVLVVGAAIAWGERRLFLQTGILLADDNEEISFILSSDLPTNGLVDLNTH